MLQWITLALFGVLTTLQVEVHVIICRLPTELREQLVKFERQMALVPQLLVEDKVQESMKEAEDRRSHLNKEANEKLKELEKIRVSVAGIAWPHNAPRAVCCNPGSTSL